MPEIKEFMRFMEFLKSHQPAHSYRLALISGNPMRSTWTWRWLHYLEDLGLARKISDDGRKTARKEYALTERGETLLDIMRQVFKDKPALVDMYAYRSRKSFRRNEDLKVA